LRRLVRVRLRVRIKVGSRVRVRVRVRVGVRVRVRVARAATLQGDDVRLADEERLRRGGLRRQEGHTPCGRHASGGSCRGSGGCRSAAQRL